MPTDENTRIRIRIRIRQYLIELADEQAEDAVIESMPPIPWTQLATNRRTVATPAAVAPRAWAASSGQG